MEIDAGRKEVDNLLGKMERRVAKEYKQASKEVEQKLNDYLQKFQTKDIQKQEQLRNGQITQAEYNRWRTGQIAMGDRWRNLRDDLAQDYTNANKIAESIVDGYMPEVYALSHNYATYEVEKGANLDTSYTLYNRQAVERLMRDNPKMLPKPGKQMSADIRAGKVKRWNQKQVQSVMIQSLLQGESIPKIAKRLASKVAVKNTKSAVRYARTMTTGAENAGRQNGYQRAVDMGVKMKQGWLAALDARTRDAHRQLDGQVRDVGKPFEVDGYKIMRPGDPTAPGYLVWNCRCCLVALVEGANQDLTDLTHRNTNKMGGMSYEDWKKGKEKKKNSSKGTSNTSTSAKKQSTIKGAKTVADIENYMNGKSWFRNVGQNTKVSLNGCDVESARTIASAYEKVFTKYPQLVGKFDAPDSNPVGMSSNTFAWCYTRANGKVQVNPSYYGDYGKLTKAYNRTVVSKFHPDGTTAESIVIHEIGHAIDGLLARQGVKGGYTASGGYRFASSSMRNEVMKACGLTVDFNDIRQNVSGYATKNTREWFAECFAEYMDSANPRAVATEFGRRLDQLIARVI